MEVQCGEGGVCHSGASRPGRGLCGPRRDEDSRPRHSPASLVTTSAWGVTEAEAGPPKPWSTPCLTVPHLPLMQGYKMDDLLTSYVQQLMSTVNRQRGPRGSVSGHP